MKTKIAFIMTGIILGLALLLTAFGCAQDKPAQPSAPAPVPAPASPAAKTSPTSVPAPTTVLPASTASSSAAEFFKKNMVTLLINGRAGGGTDFTGRVFATFWSEVTGGQMVPKNEDGGGGATAINIIYGSTKPDGLIIGTAMLGAHMVLPTLFKSPGVQFDYKKLSFIGETYAEPYAFAIGAKQPYQSLADVQKTKGHVFGGDQPGGANTLDAVLITEFFGLKEARVATGYRGATLETAAARGEILGYATTISTIKEEVEKGFIKPPFVVFDYQRHPAFFPDTPTVTELVNLTPQQQSWFKLAQATGGGKVYYAPPGLPEDKLQFLRDAFDKIQTIPAFQDQIRAGGPWVKPTSGKEIMIRANAITAIPDSDVEVLRKTIEKYIAVK